MNVLRIQSNELRKGGSSPGATCIVCMRTLIRSSGCPASPRHPPPKPPLMKLFSPAFAASVTQHANQNNQFHALNMSELRTLSLLRHVFEQSPALEPRLFEVVLV